jgi:hypothetical protein
VQYYHDSPAVSDDISSASSFFTLLSSTTTLTRQRRHHQPTWFAGAELCIREIHRLAEPRTPEEAHSLRNAQRDLDTLIGNLANLTAYFPSLSTFSLYLSHKKY